jgi:hypothetical protein
MLCDETCYKGSMFRSTPFERWDNMRSTLVHIAFSQLGWKSSATRAAGLYLETTLVTEEADLNDRA